MRIDYAWHFSGEPSIPPTFRGPGPHELTLEQLKALTKDHAVLLYKNDDGETVIAFDTHRGRFRQR
jgi:hypothetical protein